MVSNYEILWGGHIGHPHKGGRTKKKQKSNFELAQKLIPFSWFHWFQKYKDELWEPMGSAASGRAIFGFKMAQNTKEMAKISHPILFWP